MRKILKPIIGCICLVSLAACGSLSPKPPSWTNEMFSQDGSFLYFTGMSDKHTSEVESVNLAVSFAEQGFARFCGVDLDSFVEHQGSSEAALGVNMDTSTTSSNITLKSQARIKQSVVAKRFTKEIGNFFKTWIVLAIPASQYNECQAYKEKLAKDNSLEKKNSILLSENTELSHDNDRLLNYQDLQLRVGQLEAQNNDLREEVRIAQRESFVDKNKAQDLEKQLLGIKIHYNKMVNEHSVLAKRANDLDLALLKNNIDLKFESKEGAKCTSKLREVKVHLENIHESMTFCQKMKSKLASLSN